MWEETSNETASDASNAEEDKEGQNEEELKETNEDGSD